MAKNLSLPPLNTIHTVVFDFDGVFTDNKVWVDQEGRESVRCDRSDGLAFDLVRSFQAKRKINIEFFILSKEKNPVVMARANKLKLECRNGIKDKLEFMTVYLTKKFPEHVSPFSGLIYLGNDLNDLPIMRRAGCAVAPSDAHYRIREIAHIVLDQRGGDGFVREFVERLFNISQLSHEEIDELISNC